MWISAVVLLVSLGVRVESRAAVGRPNVVILLADDAGWGDFGFNGNTNIRTPNIHAIAFIEANRERPFVCYLPFNTPHSPFCVPDAYWDRFKDDPIKMRARPGDKEVLDETRCVLAMCENLDWNVGRVLKKLEELKL